VISRYIRPVELLDMTPRPSEKNSVKNSANTVPHAQIPIALAEKE